MSSNSIAEVKENVNSLEDRPILVVLPTRQYYLDMSEEIPFNGEPQYGQGWGGSPEDQYGLEARG